MMSARRVVAGCLVLVLGLVTAHQGQAQDTKPKPRNPDVILAEEFAGRGDIQTAYDAVRRLRPQFLRKRGSATIAMPQAEIQVYTNGVRRGGPAILREIPASSVVEIRYMNSNDATTRYGTDHSNGAILVTTQGTNPP